MPDDTNFLTLFDKSTDIRKLKSGELLFAKGDEAHEMFIVRSGELQIADGNIVFETVGPGGMIGEMAIVDKAPRSATVKALTAAEVIPVDEKRFLWMVVQTPYFAIRVLRTLTTRLRKTNEIAKAMH